MTVLERKAKIIRDILNDDNESLLDKIECLISESKNKFPCQYTVEEVKEGIRQSIRDVKEGRFTAHEDVKKRFSI